MEKGDGRIPLSIGDEEEKEEEERLARFDKKKMKKEEKMEEEKKKRKMETKVARGCSAGQNEREVCYEVFEYQHSTNQPWGVRVEKEIERGEVTRRKVRRKRTEVKRRRRWPREEEVEKEFNGSEEVRGCKEFSRLGRN